MQPDRFTIKSQEAIQAAQRLAEDRRNPQLAPEHLLAVLLEQDGGVVVPVLSKLGRRPRQPARADVNRALDALPTLGAELREQRPGHRTSWSTVLRAAEKEAAELGDEYVSTEHLLLALARGRRRRPARRLAEPAPPRTRCCRRSRRCAAPHRVTDQNPEDKYQALEKYGARPDRGGRAGQARPGDRPRRGDPPRDPGALAAHQEQPGADRRARRGQDGDRRGPGPAHRRRRRARGAASDKR